MTRRRKRHLSDAEASEMLKKQDALITKRMAAGANYHDAMWPPRGVQAFHRSGLWFTKHTGTHVTYHCKTCDVVCAEFTRDVHAFTRSAKGKAAVRSHVLEKHPELAP